MKGRGIAHLLLDLYWQQHSGMMDMPSAWDDYDILWKYSPGKLSANHNRCDLSALWLLAWPWCNPRSPIFPLRCSCDWQDRCATESNWFIVSFQAPSYLSLPKEAWKSTSFCCFCREPGSKSKSKDIPEACAKVMELWALSSTAIKCYAIKLQPFPV